jgi:hypothetical protein
VVVSAALGVASPALAQITPSPDPDPQVRPDPVTAQSNTAPAQRPAPHPPAVRSTPQPVSSGTGEAAGVTAPQSSGPRVKVSARPAHPARRASKPRPTRARTVHDAALAAWKRLAVPAFPPLAAPQADDRSQARELSLAAIALLLVVIAGGSLLRLTARLPRDVHRGRPA